MPPARLHCALLTIAAALLMLDPALPAQTEPAQYVGSDACSACHEELAGGIANSAHSRLFKESAPARQGCEACHGPGSNHVNSGGDGSLVFSFKAASAAQISRRCGACHETLANTVHLHRTTTCLSCHAAHHYRQKQFLLVSDSFQLCTDCHDRQINSRGSR